jgi:hypothetical protein
MIMTMIINDNNGNEDHENDGDFDAVLDKRNCDKTSPPTSVSKQLVFTLSHHYWLTPKNNDGTKEQKSF